MITDADIEKLKQVFATKDDLQSMEARMDSKYATKDYLKAMEARMDKKYATKEDLNRFATKDDLNRFATKDDLNRFATKDDLNEIKTEMHLMEKRIRHDMPTRGEIRLEISSLHAELQETKNEIIATITEEILKLYGRSAEQDERLEDIDAMQRSQRVAIEDLKTRVKRLEATHST